MQEELETAMAKAVVAGDADEVRALLSRGADPHATLRPAGANYTRSLLQEACHRGHGEVVTALVQAGVELSDKELCLAASHPKDLLLRQMVELKPWSQAELQRAFRSSITYDRALCACALVPRISDWGFSIEIGAEHRSGGPLPLVHKLVAQGLFEVLEALALDDSQLQQELSSPQVNSLRQRNLAKLCSGAPLDLARAVLDSHLEWTSSPGAYVSDVDKLRLQRAAQTLAWLEKRLQGKVGAATRKHLPRETAFATEGDRVQVIAGKARGSQGVVKQTPPGPNPEYRRVGVLTDDGRMVWAMQKELRRVANEPVGGGDQASRRGV